VNDERIVQLLSELREGQKEQIALSRDVAQKSLDAQRTAIEIQRRGARLYRVVISVTALLVVGFIVYLYSLPI
jgi:hypothetical protein